MPRWTTPALTKQTAEVKTSRDQAAITSAHVATDLSGRVLSRRIQSNWGRVRMLPVVS